MFIGCIVGKTTRSHHNKSGSVANYTITNTVDLIHTDQAESSQPGRQLTYSGWNNPIKMKYFTVLVESVSKKAFTHFQHSSGAHETILDKRRLENLALRHGVTIKAYRVDNGVFNSKAFMSEL